MLRRIIPDIRQGDGIAWVRFLADRHNDLDVANNCDATQKTNYIDGYSDGGLSFGEKVGEEVSLDATFPV